MDIYLRLLIANGKKEVWKRDILDLVTNQDSHLIRNGILKFLVQILRTDSVNSILPKSFVGSFHMCT